MEIDGKVKAMSLFGRADLYDPSGGMLFSCRAPLRILFPEYKVFSGSSKENNEFNIIGRKILGYDSYYFVKDAQGNLIGGLQGPPVPALRTRRKPWKIFDCANKSVGEIIDRSLRNAGTYVKGGFELDCVLEDFSGFELARIFSDYNFFWKSFINFNITMSDAEKSKMDKRLVVAGIFMVMLQTR